MPEIARLIGGAGTGKTTELMRILETVLERGIDPLEVGFVSFTRAARREASSRAADRFGGSGAQLEAEGWFRTLHSVCFRCLEESKDRMVVDDRSGSKWLEENIGEASGKPIGGENLDDADFTAATDVGVALSIWHAARNRLEPLAAAWQRCDAASDTTPPLGRCTEIINAYEQAKRLDNKSDFTDLLGRFAGWRFYIEGQEETAPEGYTPHLPVWFFDEQQDTSALLDAVCQRLIESSTWVYVVGDPFQAIYGWAGADSKHFMEWNVAKSRVMPKSYRCPSQILNFGEDILRLCSNYWNREIEPADHCGVARIERLGPALFDEIDPSESWLVLARTNYHANRLASRIKAAGIPWRPTRGHGGWARPKKNLALNALCDLAAGFVVSNEEWQAVLEYTPTKLLVRGTKAIWQDSGRRPQDEGRFLHGIADWGATEELIGMLRSGSWPTQIEGGPEYVAARQQWGVEVVTEPRVRVGTIHSVKGAEADNVLWLTTATRAVSKASEEQDAADEECRVAYVAATRARKKLVVAVEPNQRHRFRVPA